MNPSMDDILMHYGMPRRSGRYPWGSGENPYQHSGDFLARVNELKKKGLSEKQIADAIGLTTTQLRVQKSLANEERRTLQVDEAKGLKDKGWSTNKIAEKMGIPESTVRSLLNPNSEARMNQSKVTAEFLKKMVDEKGMVDVGTGVERELGISKEKLNEALYILERDGYAVYGGGLPQVTNPGKQTNLKVLCPPGTEHKEIYQYDKINSVRDYDKILSEDGSKIRPAFVYPASMDSKRLAIRYADQGGDAKDGLIELRRGVKDLDLGESRYAQVRILVDGTHYIKGMAVYADDLPKGVDVRFNTNKTSDKSKMDVLKPISKDNPDNPFGSLIKEHGGQSYYIDKDGKEKLSLINKRADEGDWGNWSDHLPSQFLSKQSMNLINKQLNMSKADKKDEFDEIKALTNPTVKKALLESFASDCDSNAVHLQAAALPRQKYHVLIPMESIKDTEVYAPNYKNGETVALIRYPHGGTFEIPIVKVNNKLNEGKRVLTENAKDAIGINKKVADRLSGADFDGDAVMVIPCNSSSSKVRINSTNPLKGLEGFDPKMEYPERTGMKYMKNPKTGKDNTQLEMGKISNLITDMTLRGANEEELARAVRHSMVVIDAAKHKLDYKKSEADNNIAALKKAYQGRVTKDGRYHEGASTLISASKSEVSVLKRKGQAKVNQKGKDWYDPSKPEGALVYKSLVKNSKDKEWYDPSKPEGAKMYVQTKDTYVDKSGKTITRTQKSTKMAETTDARTLISNANTPQERAYADYANYMKNLANEARMEMVHTGRIEYSPSAKQTYSTEVASLTSQLNVSLKNAPRERMAQVIATTAVKAKTRDNPDITNKELKKIKQQELVKARAQVGAERKPISISDREWEAIQSGAISENVLKQILDHADIDVLRERATPRSKTSLSDAKINKIKAMSNSGYTNAEIAEALNISASAVSKYLK